MNDKKDYEVGYGKPPKNGQFRKGQSGNPKGRRKGHKTTAKILQKVLEERVPIRIGDRTLKVTKLEAMIFANVARASHGNYRALSHILRTDHRLNPPPPPDEYGRRGVLRLPSEQFHQVSLALNRREAEEAAMALAQRKARHR